MGEQLTFTITELSREFGITPRAIRFYEDQGLLQPTRAGRNRVYGRDDRTRLKLTLRGKRLGLSLADIRELIQMYDSARNSPQLIERFLEILAVRRAAMEERRHDIDAVLREIEVLEQRCLALLNGGDESDAHLRDAG